MWSSKNGALYNFNRFLVGADISRGITNARPFVVYVGLVSISRSLNRKATSSLLLFDCKSKIVVKMSKPERQDLKAQKCQDASKKR